MGRIKVVCSVIILLLWDLLIISASCSRLAQSTKSQKDITNPVTTVPTIIPALTLSIPADSFTLLSSSWCIASPGSSRLAMQVAMDYACGYGGADCSDIQPGGKCYYPISVRDHASYAFNQYYQKNPIPTSCNFAGTAMVSTTNPSTEACQYPSTSTSSSILNTTNTSGATVFGAVPSGPTTSSATRSRAVPNDVGRSFITASSSIMFLACICL